MVGLAGGNQPDDILAFGERHMADAAMKPGEHVVTRLTVISPPVFHDDFRGIEKSRKDIGEIQPVFGKVALTLALIPAELNRDNLDLV